VRRLFTWAAGAAGGLAAYKAVSRRRPAEAPLAVPAEEAVVDPAAELRAKLAEAKAVEADEAVGPDDPRRAVREQARAAIDEMQSG
jgi:hypothetical protein